MAALVSALCGLRVEPDSVSWLATNLPSGRSPLRWPSVEIRTMWPNRARGVDVAGGGVAADHVDDAVGALAAGQLAHPGDDVFLVVPDRGAGAEAEGVGGLFVRRDDRDRVGPEDAC